MPRHWIFMGSLLFGVSLAGAGVIAISQNFILQAKSVNAGGEEVSGISSSVRPSLGQSVVSPIVLRSPSYRLTAGFLRTPTFLGDYDGDGDIDLRDYGELRGCVTGPGTSPLMSRCYIFDFDSDDDVDLVDFGSFQNAFTGSF